MDFLHGGVPTMTTGHFVHTFMKFLLDYQQFSMLSPGVDTDSLFTHFDIVRAISAIFNVGNLLAAEQFCTTHELSLFYIVMSHLSTFNMTDSFLNRFGSEYPIEVGCLRATLAPAGETDRRLPVEEAIVSELLCDGADIDDLLYQVSPSAVYDAPMRLPEDGFTPHVLQLLSLVDFVVPPADHTRMKLIHVIAEIGSADDVLAKLVEREDMTLLFELVADSRAAELCRGDDAKSGALLSHFPDDFNEIAAHVDSPELLMRCAPPSHRVLLASVTAIPASVRNGIELCDYEAVRNKFLAAPRLFIPFRKEYSLLINDSVLCRLLSETELIDTCTEYFLYFLPFCKAPAGFQAA
jgi:hypothetical protein